MHDRAAECGHVDDRPPESRVATRAARRELRRRHPQRHQPGAGRDPGEAVITGLAGDQAGHRCPAPVAVGEPVGRLDIVTARLHAGQPWPRPHTGVQNRDQLPVAAGKPPRRRRIQNLLTRRHRFEIGARDDAGRTALAVLLHRRHRTGCTGGRRRAGVDLRAVDRHCRRAGPQRGNQSRCETTESPSAGRTHRLSTHANSPTRYAITGISDASIPDATNPTSRRSGSE